MFLKIENLNKYYGKNHILKDINFEARKGEIICLLGPSGCGKTTLLNSIGGFTKISSGIITLDKEDITNYDANERNVSTVFQSYGLFSHMNVFDNISYGLKFKKLKKEEKLKKTMKMLEIVGLINLEKRMISEISGGQQQRTALARSLIINPKLLLLDEPFSNLDKNLKVQMREEIKKLVQYFNMTTILVTHDQEDAFSIADRVILMNDGKIIQDSKPILLYNQPKNDFALNFIGKSNKINNSFVRPENIYITDNMNDTECEIIDIAFHGMTIDYKVRVFKTNNYLIISEMNKKQCRKIGDKIFIKYDLSKISEEIISND